MPLTKCVRCEKLFNKVNGPVCSVCMPTEETDFDTIRSTIEDNPDINAETVSELSGVSVACVLRMMDSGLISNISLGDKVKCGQCGAPAISPTKKLCQNCLESLNRKMLDARKSIQLNQKKKVESGGYNSVRELIDAKKR
ncbi:MAG: hypothetical protein COA73_00165 [Candidatus Hydrogenedentota bacterium]|nr:MAG: hypothetical protein COA73_00165 [Candidatus Hydrogenedentota bacterium]